MSNINVAEYMNWLNASVCIYQPSGSKKFPNSLDLSDDGPPVPVLDQGPEPACTAYSNASIVGRYLGQFLQESILPDARGLWENQKKFGTAGERGDHVLAAMFILDKYGLRFEAASGQKGLYVPSRGTIEYFSDIGETIEVPAFRLSYEKLFGDLYIMRPIINDKQGPGNPFSRHDRGPR